MPQNLPLPPSAQLSIVQPIPAQHMLIGTQPTIQHNPIPQWMVPAPGI